jgi:hypothetical protein
MRTRASKRGKGRSDDDDGIGSALRAVEQLTGGKLAEGMARQVADEAKAQPAKNPAAVALSRLGASKGGKARAKKLSAKKRAEIAKKAATARWGKKPR